MSKSYPWDERRNIVIPGDAHETVVFSAKHFVYSAQKAIDQHGRFVAALSGGSTPNAIYTELAKNHYDSLDWKKVYLFWGDERSVAPDSLESNYHMAMQSGIADLPIPSHQIHRMVAEKNIKDNARAYERLLQEVLHNNPLDFIMLGVGEDGHTASLFPDTSALLEETHLVVANHVPEKNTWRMTMTFNMINSAMNIVIYAIGPKKKEIVRDVLHDKDETYPSSKIGSIEHKALWILDKDAAALIQKDF